jgi:hypothetical protein
MMRAGLESRSLPRGKRGSDRPAIFVTLTLDLRADPRPDVSEESCAYQS